MACVGCGGDVYASAKFCPHCGRPQQAVCPACAAPPVAADAAFCGECGTPIAPAVTDPAPQEAAKPVAERRVCSVLFADLVGFTPLSEARDPEEVRELLSRYFDTARTIVGRYGGGVEKVIGDAVMGGWGGPGAPEGGAGRGGGAGGGVVGAGSGLW